MFYIKIINLILILKIYLILKKMVLKHPKEEIKKPLVLNKQIIDETNLDDKFYNQQFDSDPYLLD